MHLLNLLFARPCNFAALCINVDNANVADHTLLRYV